MLDDKEFFGRPVGLDLAGQRLHCMHGSCPFRPKFLLLLRKSFSQGLDFLGLGLRRKLVTANL